MATIFISFFCASSFAAMAGLVGFALVRLPETTMVETIGLLATQTPGRRLECMNLLDSLFLCVSRVFEETARIGIQSARESWSVYW